MTRNLRRIPALCLFVCSIACLSVLMATAQEIQDGSSDTKKLDAGSPQRSISAPSLLRMHGAEESAEERDSSDKTVSSPQRETGITDPTGGDSQALINKRSDEQTAANSAALAA